MVPGSPNPDLIADQKMSFSTPIFRPDLRSLKSIPIFGPGLIWPVPGSQILGETQFSPVLFSCFGFPNSAGPNYPGGWNRLGLIRQKLCHHYQVRAETKTFSKCISNTHISILFLFI